MFFASTLRQRRRRPELMDQPGLDEERHIQALHGLERINRWTAAARLVWPGICEAARLAAPNKLRVLDVATGAADTPIRLWHQAQAIGLPLEIAACDRSATALAHARRQAEQSAAAVRFFHFDILSGPLPETYDVVVCSLFLHHLADDEAVQALETMGRAATRLVLVQDLRRCLMGWWLAYLGTRLLSVSPIVHFDGPASVAGAFSAVEMGQLAQRAGLHGAKTTRHWPCRLLLNWNKTNQ
jgi:2-polyprenyl-3-methyl-5-hydroxy-6-metoxy-1,4-benzoquinol methylase